MPRGKGPRLWEDVLIGLVGGGVTGTAIGLVVVSVGGDQRLPLSISILWFTILVSSIVAIVALVWAALNRSYTALGVAAFAVSVPVATFLWIM